MKSGLIFYLYMNIFRKKLQNELASVHLCRNTHLLRLGSFLLTEKLRLIEDEEYILLFSQLLHQSMKSSAISQSFGSLFLSTKYMNTACKIINLLIRTIFGIISKADVSKSYFEFFNKTFNSQVSKIYDARKIINTTSTLHNFCTCTEDVWPILKGKHDFQKIMEKLCANMLKSEASKENIHQLTVCYKENTFF